MTKLNWRDASKELPDDDRNVVVKVSCNGHITKECDYYCPFIKDWACNKESEGHTVIEWLWLHDIPD